MKPVNVSRMGDRLRDRRESMGLTQADVALKAGVTRQTVARVEQAVEDVSVGTMGAVLRALNMTLLLDDGTTQHSPRSPVEDGLDAALLAARHAVLAQMEEHTTSRFAASSDTTQSQ